MRLHIRRSGAANNAEAAELLVKKVGVRPGDPLLEKLRNIQKHFRIILAFLSYNNTVIWAESRLI